MVFYGVVTAQTDKMMEFFASREDAEAIIGWWVSDPLPIIAAVLHDEPEWAGGLSVLAIDFGSFVPD